MSSRGIKFSILVASVEERRHTYLIPLLDELARQTEGRKDVEVLVFYDNLKRGVPGKRNVLIQAAQGDFQAFIDDDDTVSPDYVEEIIAAIDRNPEADCVLFDCLTIIDGKKKVHCKYGIEYEYSKPPLKDDWRGKPAHTMAYASRIAKKYDWVGKDEEIGRDMDWVARAHKEIKVEERIEKTLYYYLKNSETSLTRRRMLANNPRNKMKKLIINSLPKSGTNLLKACVELFGFEYMERRPHLCVLSNYEKYLGDGYYADLCWNARGRTDFLERNIVNLIPGRYRSIHTGSGGILDKALSCDVRPILVLRDPRAVIASQPPYVETRKGDLLHEHFEKMGNVRDKYLHILRGGVVPTRLGNYYFNSMRECFEYLKPWIDSDEVLKVKFEDMVGESGGGDKDKQRQTINAIGEWIGADLKLVDKVQEECFGFKKERTFRVGKIDSWKTEIPSDIIKEIEDTLGDYIKLVEEL